MTVETPAAHWTSNWGKDLALSHCQVCDGNFIVPLDLETDMCPYCGQSVLIYIDETEDITSCTPKRQNNICHFPYHVTNFGKK